ncbi:MAG: universal stress protein [Thermodesulfobacteriota bacterium]
MKYKTIICPVDATELSELAIGHAVYMSKVSEAKLVLLHVVEKWYRGLDVVGKSAEWKKLHDVWLKEGRDLLDKKAAKINDMKNVETVLRDGDAAHEIVAEASERAADVIVMATHRHSPVGKIFYGSVIDKVTKHSPCPVLWVFK